MNWIRSLQAPSVLNPPNTLDSEPAKFAASGSEFTDITGPERLVNIGFKPFS